MRRRGGGKRRYRTVIAVPFQRKLYEAQIALPPTDHASSGSDIPHRIAARLAPFTRGWCPSRAASRQ